MKMKVHNATDVSKKRRREERVQRAEELDCADHELQIIREQGKEGERVQTVSEHVIYPQLEKPCG